MANKKKKDKKKAAAAKAKAEAEAEPGEEEEEVSKSAAKKMKGKSVQAQLAAQRLAEQKAYEAERAKFEADQKADRQDHNQHQVAIVVRVGVGQIEDGNGASTQ